uniref:F-box domain-containing protein n=1 Tax=Kalanchoe fedtschenkoi TaxID=63787 RepID=A0A7N0UR38_KALFE
MGSSFSAIAAFVTSSSPSSTPPPNPGLADMPVDCLALVLARLQPPEICRFATLNRAFRAASLSHTLWDSKLPHNYTLIVDKLLLGEPHVGLGSRTIYATLSRANPFHGGTKLVWLHRSGSGLCMSISSKALAITGVDDRRYWTHLPTQESRFGTVAYLQQTWWLEVEGEVEFPLPAGSYNVVFRLQLGRASKRFCRRVCDSKHVRGWDKKPASFQLWTSDGQYCATQHFLTDPGKWINYHVGSFVVDKRDQMTKVRFSMTQIDCTHPKGGLCIDSVLILPKMG